MVADFYLRAFHAGDLFDLLLARSKVTFYFKSQQSALALKRRNQKCNGDRR